MNTLLNRLKSNYFDSNYKQRDLENDLTTLSRTKFISGIVVASIIFVAVIVLYMYFIDETPIIVSIVNDIRYKIK